MSEHLPEDESEITIEGYLESARRHYEELANDDEDDSVS